MKYLKCALKYENGVLSDDYFSFKLPDGYFFTLNSDSVINDILLEFYSPDELLHIEIRCCNCEFGNALDYFKNYFSENEELKRLSDYLTVKRGNGTATAVYYVCGEDFCPTYEERYYHKTDSNGTNTFIVKIYLWSQENKEIKQTIFEAVKTEAISNFLESISYCDN